MRTEEFGSGSQMARKERSSPADNHSVAFIVALVHFNSADMSTHTDWKQERGDEVSTH